MGSRFFKSSQLRQMFAGIFQISQYEQVYIVAYTWAEDKYL